MYSIYADGVCIYNDVFSLDNMKVVNPKLTLEDSAAGSLEMTLPPTNAAYDTIVRMVTDISVKKNGEEIWAGRALSESRDFWNNRVLYCEGSWPSSTTRSSRRRSMPGNRSGSTSTSSSPSTTAGG